MIAFTFGETFPLHNKANGTEYCRIDLNDSFFDICYYFPTPDNKHINAWGKDVFKYGVYENSNIPFLLIEFEVNKARWCFDLSINIHRILDDKADIWLNSEGRTVRMYLIEASTNILVGTRMIEVSVSVADYIRDICENQDERYASAKEVDGRIDRIIDSISTAEMIDKTKMIKTK
jgi:hypothetical protein